MVAMRSLLVVGLVVVASGLSFPASVEGQSVVAQAWDPRSGAPIVAGAYGAGLVPTVTDWTTPGPAAPGAGGGDLRWAGRPPWLPPGALTAEEAYARAGQLRAQQGYAGPGLPPADHGCPCKALGGCGCANCACGQLAGQLPRAGVSAQIAAGPADCSQCCLPFRQRFVARPGGQINFNGGGLPYGYAPPAWYPPPQQFLAPQSYGYAPQFSGSFQGPQFRGNFSVCPNGMCPLR